MAHQHIKIPENRHESDPDHDSTKHAHAAKLDVQRAGVPLYLQRSQTPLLQRQPVEEEEELQTKSEGPHSKLAPSAVVSHARSLKHGGLPLPGHAKSFFESRFGQDL